MKVEDMNKINGKYITEDGKWAYFVFMENSGSYSESKADKRILNKDIKPGDYFEMEIKDKASLFKKIEKPVDWNEGLDAFFTRKPRKAKKVDKFENLSFSKIDLETSISLDNNTISFVDTPAAAPHSITDLYSILNTNNNSN